MFAILPLSSCVKALGVLDVRRSGRFGDPESDANYRGGQPQSLLCSRGRTCLHIACFALAVEIVVIRLIFDENAAAEIIKCGLLVAFKHRPCETKYIGGHLIGLVLAKLEQSLFAHQLQFCLYSAKQLPFSLNDAVLLSDEANENCKFEVAQGPHLLDQAIVHLFHRSSNCKSSLLTCRGDGVVKDCPRSLLLLPVGDG